MSHDKLVAARLALTLVDEKKAMELLARGSSAKVTELADGGLRIEIARQSAAARIGPAPPVYAILGATCVTLTVLLLRDVWRERGVLGEDAAQLIHYTCMLGGGGILAGVLSAFHLLAYRPNHEVVTVRPGGMVKEHTICGDRIVERIELADVDGLRAAESHVEFANRAQKTRHRVPFYGSAEESFALAALIARRMWPAKEWQYERYDRARMVYAIFAGPAEAPAVWPRWGIARRPRKPVKCSPWWRRAGRLFGAIRHWFRRAVGRDKAAAAKSLLR